LKMVDGRADDIRRQTFTEEEFDAVLEAAETYADDGSERTDNLHRWITSYWIKINALAGMRNGDVKGGVKPGH